jgi:predicted ATPase
VLYFRFSQNAYEVNLEPAADGLIISSEIGHYFGYEETRGIPDYAVPFAHGTKESLILEEAAQPQGRIARYVRDAVSGWVVYHFHDTSDSSPAKQL